MIRAAIAMLAVLMLGQGAQEPKKAPTKAPPTLPGYGKPVDESKTDEKKATEDDGKGWRRWRFDELGISIELPGKPEAKPIEDWTDEDLKTCAAYANYEGEEEFVGYDLVVYKPTPGSETTLEEDADSNKGTLDDPESAKEKRTPTFAAGKDALRVDLEYQDEDEKKTAKMATLHFKVNGLTVYLRTFYYADQADAAKDVDRILASVKLVKKD